AACVWDENAPSEAMAPTLDRFVDTDEHTRQAQADLRQWARQNLPGAGATNIDSVDLMRPSNVVTDIVATLLYPVTDRPYRELYELAVSWSGARRQEVIDVAMQSRTRRDDLLRGFRRGLY